MKKELLFCPLGGSGEIGMNMNLFAYGDPGNHKWIMVDIGVTFADDTIPGIDLIYPDPGFITEKKDNLLGIILTHAHEDHIGAIAHLWPKLKCKIYATPFTAVLIKEKFKEKHNIEFKLAKIYVRNIEKYSKILDPTILVNSIDDILEDSSINVIIETMGGIELANNIILKAIEKGKHIITANKDLLAHRLTHYLELCKNNNTNIGIEASVCGGIPIINSGRKNTHFHKNPVLVCLNAVARLNSSP